MEFTFSSAAIKRLLYLSIIAAFVFTIQQQLHIPQSYWLIWTALTLSLLTTGKTIPRRMAIIAVNGSTSACLVLASSWMALSMPAAAIYLLITTLLFVYIGQRYTSYFLSAFLCTLFTILAIGLPLPVEDSIDAFNAILIATFIVVCSQLLLVPLFRRDSLAESRLLALVSLQSLSGDLFDCLLQPEYVDNLYLFERRLHKQKMRFMRALDELQVNGNGSLTQMAIKLDLLYDILLDCAQVRWRVTDHSIFQVCKEDLIAISFAIDAVFKNLRKNAAILRSTAILQEKIQRLETSNQNILRVAAREPLAIILFIESLKALQGAFEKLATCQNQT